MSEIAKFDKKKYKVFQENKKLLHLIHRRMGIDNKRISTQNKSQYKSGYQPSKVIIHVALVYSLHFQHHFPSHH